MSQRRAIRMSEEEVAAFLEGPHKLQLATIGPGGWPHLVTMYYAVVDGQIAFWTYRSSQKAANLRRDPRVTCLVEEGDRYDRLRGVQIRGHVRTIDEPEAVLPIGRLVYGRYVEGLGNSLEAFLEPQARKRSAYLVQAQEVVSWDHRKLTMAGGG